MNLKDCFQKNYASDRCQTRNWNITIIIQFVKSDTEALHDGEVYRDPYVGLITTVGDVTSRIADINVDMHLSQKCWIYSNMLASIASRD